MIIKSKFLLSVLFLLCVCSGLNAQNLLDMQGWVPGSGGTGIFAQNGNASENGRDWGEGPNGKRVVLWKASPNGDHEADGGWNTTGFSINTQMMYRFVIWLKKTNSNDGYSYFGCQAAMNLDNNFNSNPYFWYGDLPALDKWYLLVGYIHASNDPSTVNYGGIYDGTTGVKVLDISDFKFEPNTTHAVHRTYLYYDPNVNDRQYFYAPRVDLVNGNEPAISTLLGIQGISAEQGYFSGKVGIKTTNPGDYDLAVNGKIRSHEIKVETANWPDYVFDQDYQLLGLQELDAYIKANKHLPEMPSAKEVEANGMALGELIKLQQKKIEELTLHLIEKDKALTDTQKKLIQLAEAHQKSDLINTDLLKRLAEVEKNIKAINPKKLNSNK